MSQCESMRARKAQLQLQDFSHETVQVSLDCAKMLWNESSYEMLYNWNIISNWNRSSCYAFSLTMTLNVGSLYRHPGKERLTLSSVSGTKNSKSPTRASPLTRDHFH